MSVQTQQFRVVGVNRQTGKDVSVILDAGTKAAAEVKAAQMHIETTHIVRIKQPTPEPPDEHDLFAAEAAEALAGKRIDQLIEAVVPPEEPRLAPQTQGDVPPTSSLASTTQPVEVPSQVVAATTRPTDPELASRQAGTDQVSGLSAFGLVLVILLGISAGTYFVLVHQPNRIQPQHNELIFGQDFFTGAVEPHAFESHTLDRKASGRETPVSITPATPPIAPDQQIKITPLQANPTQPGSTSAPTSTSADAQTAPLSTPSPNSKRKLKLQSIVTTHKGRFAVINGKLYKEGDAFGSASLVSVADDWVLIERDGKQFTLHITATTSK